MKDRLLLLLTGVVATAMVLWFFRVAGEHSFAILAGITVVGLLLGGGPGFAKKFKKK